MKKYIEDTGSIVITEDDGGNCTVTARLVDGNIWMTQYEIARLLGVYEATVRNNLRALFKSRLLSEHDVTHPSWNGQSGFGTLYGLEAIIYMSFRTETYRAKAFRKWVLHTLNAHHRTGKSKEPSVILVYNYGPIRTGERPN
ncbi:hypothetical protein [Gabonibacter chumensis]|uniref:hypothetical protein n=1 Tax=Gabonibacter chumensis TaxID=2972474 RepID=UPI00257386BB|nr:hypothetical protein [Gabonibacter chumensis]MCR9012646.1 hypothetical protein [Gabonibacter chumensis]